ncbi:MAG: GNAT family N-acetyltransferase [Alphaproteobacteria bacterium]|nr:MAG: GNAT family N-acetyltransferase [Alphaproteobacteria bacterium]
MQHLLRPTEIVASAASPVWIRTAAVSDLEGLSEHFENLSQSSRHNRFMGAVSNVSKIAFDCLKRSWKSDHFTLVAEWRAQGRDAIIGEATYGFDREKGCGEFAISVADRWQHRGLGSALLGALQLRAVSLGHFELFGEALKTNHEMTNLARKAGFAFTRSLDWRAVRFDKRLSG